MTVGTITDIRTKIRKLTGRGNDFQLTDAMIDDYINSFYSYDFPAQFRSLKLKDRYVFNTIQGIDTYAFDSENYLTVEEPCYIQKISVPLVNNPNQFYANWGFTNGAGSQFQDNFAIGANNDGPYVGTLTASPIVRSVNTNPTTNPNHISIVQNILITANTGSGTLNVFDDGNGNLIGDATGGTINYQTGVITALVFTSPIPSGNQIQCQYLPVVLNRPESILFFQNQFTLRPVPDIGYTVELIAYRKPTQALTNANQYYPELTEWWETLAYGAAKKIYEDSLDPDGVALMDKGLKERYDLNETRTYAQLGKQRAGTMFAAQVDNANNYGGPAYY